MNIQVTLLISGEHIAHLVSSARDIRRTLREQEEHQRLRIQMAYDSVEQAAKENHNDKEEGARC